MSKEEPKENLAQEMAEKMIVTAKALNYPKLNGTMTLTEPNVFKDE